MVGNALMMMGIAALGHAVALTVAIGVRRKMADRKR